MPDDDRSMRETMEEVYDRMTADERDDALPVGLAFTGGEDDDEAQARAARYQTMSEIWDKYNGPEAEKWEKAEAPASWSREARRKFSDLSPDAKKMVLTEWQASHSSAHRDGRWSNYLRSQGVSSDYALDQLLALEHTLRNGSPEKKRDAAAFMLAAYDIPARTAVADAYRARARNTVQSAIISFGDALDDGGNQLRPHFKALREEMQALLDRNPGMSVQNAYAHAAAKRGLAENGAGQGKTIRQTLEETYDRIMAREGHGPHR